MPVMHCAILCKHIHCVHSLAGSVSISQEDYSEEDFDVNILSCAEACKLLSQGKLYVSLYSVFISYIISDPATKLKRFESLILELQNTIPFLSWIISILYFIR